MSEPQEAAGQSLIDLKAYYEAHKADEKEFCRVLIAYPIKKDMPYRIGEEVKVAPSDGYLVNALDDESTYYGFRTGQQLTEQTFDLSGADLPSRRLDIAPTIVVTPVAQMEKIMLGSHDAPKETYAPVDGFTVRSPQKTRFASNHELSSIFNYAGAKKETHEALLLTDASEPPLRGIIVKEDIYLMYGNNILPCRAGTMISFQVNGPVQENGLGPYTLITYPPAIVNFYLRTAPDVMLSPQPGKWKPPAP